MARLAGAAKCLALCQCEGGWDVASLPLRPRSKRRGPSDAMRIPVELFRGPGSSKRRCGMRGLQRALAGALSHLAVHSQAVA